MKKNIKIGRDPQSDIVVSSNYATVSNNHADIEMLPDGRLIFTDHSSNGSIVDGQRIHNMRIEIHRGSIIRLANSYSLSWTLLDQYFPQRGQDVVYGSTNNRPGGRETDMYAANRYSSIREEPRRNDDSIQDELQKEKAKNGWNWAAFILGWIWGVGHRCWWPLWVSIGMTLFLVLLISVQPLMYAVMVSVMQLGMFVMSIYLGVKGNSIAWDNGCFESIAHFREKEHSWTLAALIVLAVYVICFVLVFTSSVNLLSVFASFLDQ